MDKFTEAYIECALWSSTDDNDRPLDENYGPEDISPETMASMLADCVAFQSDNAELLSEAGTYTRHAGQAGHDFWLTRNHHGAGFWDRGLGPIGDKLTQASHAHGECNLYIGDDGLIHVYGG